MSNGDVSSEQNAIEPIMVDDVNDDVYHVTTERDHKPATITFKFDSHSTAVRLYSSL